MGKLNLLSGWNGLGGYLAKRSAQSVLGTSAVALAAGGSCGSSCGAGDKEEKPKEKPASCGSSCGAGDKEEKPKEKPASCGSSCGAGEKK